MRLCYLAAAATLAAIPAWANGPSQAQLAEAVEFGRVAALAPFCGVRDEAWSADLRRSEIQTGTATPHHDDSGLAAAPGSQLVIAALSYAETEALEDFAEQPASVTCEKLSHDRRLRQADDLVRRFREQANPPGS
jgi:hypothetical protein